MGVTCAILVLLFAFQRFGTSKVGFTFAPIVLLWFTANVMVNLYNIIVYYPGAPAKFTFSILLGGTEHRVTIVSAPVATMHTAAESMHAALYMSRRMSSLPSSLASRDTILL